MMPRIRAFLSYRHEEFAGDEAKNAAHRAWVEQLSNDLTAFGFEIIWDGVIRTVLANNSAVDPLELPLCKEIARALTVICDAFIPIITPSYAERIGKGKGQRNGMRHGVVFEEWQGAFWLVEKGLVKPIPILRRGGADEFGAELSGYVRSSTNYIDLRGDDPAFYKVGVLKLVARLNGLARRRNSLACTDVHKWCDAYVQWCRAKFPERFDVPIEVWPFNTGAANDFVGDANSRLRAEPGAWTEIDPILDRWREELRQEASKRSRPLTYASLTQLLTSSLHALDGQFGWQHLTKTVEFCATAFETKEIGGDAVERAITQRGIGLSLCWLADRRKDAGMFCRSVDYLIAARKVLTAERDTHEWLRTQGQIADALRAWSEVDGDRKRLLESRALYEEIIRVSMDTGENRQLRSARKYIAEIDAMLNAS
jgi:hypothetical protein